MQKVNSHRRSYALGTRKVSRTLKSRIVCLKVAFGSTARHSHDSLYLRPKLSDQSPQSTSQDVMDHVMEGLSSTPFEFISSAAHGRAIHNTEGREPDLAKAPDVSSSSVVGSDPKPGSYHDLSFSCTSSLLLKPWEMVPEDLVSKTNGEELAEETGTLSVDASNAMAKPTQRFETRSEEIDPAIEVISSTSGGLATVRPDQCGLPSWNSPHRGYGVEIGIYDSGPALPSRSSDKRLADITIPMAAEASTLSTSNELAGSGPVNAVQSFRNAQGSDQYQLRPSTSTNCVFPADHSVLPEPVPAGVGSVDRTALSKPMAGAIDTIDGVPIANFPLAPPQWAVCDGKMKLRDDDGDGSGSFAALLDKSTSSEASVQGNGINSQPGGTMWSSTGPCHVGLQHQHQNMKPASSTMPSRAISMSKHVTDLHLLCPRWGTSLPDLAWLPPLARTEVEMAALISPHWIESRGADIASTSRDSRNFHPSPSISTSSSASLLFSSPFFFFLSIPSVFILSAAVISCPSEIRQRAVTGEPTVGFAPPYSRIEKTSSGTLLSLQLTNSASPGRCIPRGQVTPYLPPS